MIIECLLNRYLVRECVSVCVLITRETLHNMCLFGCIWYTFHELLDVTSYHMYRCENHVYTFIQFVKGIIFHQKNKRKKEKQINIDVNNTFLTLIEMSPVCMYAYIQISEYFLFFLYLSLQLNNIQQADIFQLLSLHLNLERE